MKASEYIKYLNSDSGRAALRQAASILDDPSPEFSDAALVEQVEAIGFPHWAALRVFWQCTGRFAPLVCRGCEKKFRPRSQFTLDRPYCAQCVIAQGGRDALKKHRARQIATQAESHGKIQRQPCQKCGFGYDLHKHHPDYSRPLHVIWLCRRGHAAEHREMKSVARETIHASG